jgi:hypothetical protein
MRDIFILNEIWVQDKTPILLHTFLASTIKLPLLCNLNFIKVNINLEKYVIN